MKKKVVIVGCGFAGYECLRKLSTASDRFDLTVFDAKTTFDFLPLLPDMVGRDFPASILTRDISEICGRFHVRFIPEPILRVDPMHQTVKTAQREEAYDYLILAAGMDTNFYGNANLEQNALTLKNVTDTMKIKKILASRDVDHAFVAGGGYTGVETASNLKRWLNRHEKPTRVYLIEKMDSILGPLPAWIKDYTRQQLQAMDIRILTDQSVQKIEGEKVILRDGRVYPRSLLIWVAGVKTPRFLDDFAADKIRSRLKTDAYLRVRDTIFAAGDCAAFMHKGQPLRMAVMFAMGQGKNIARNLILLEKGKPPIAYRPLDLGWVVPVANDRASGIVLGQSLRGRLPSWLHYLISSYRSYGWRNQWGVLKYFLAT